MEGDIFVGQLGGVQNRLNGLESLRLERGHQDGFDAGAGGQAQFDRRADEEEDGIDVGFLFRQFSG
ncbi:hypothetical protein D3C83_309470 [compost metagenome]